MKSFSNTPVQYVFTVVSDHLQVLSSKAPHSQKNFGIKFGSLVNTAKVISVSCTSILIIKQSSIKF